MTKDPSQGRRINLEVPHSWFQTKLQSYSCKKSMPLAQKQTHRSVEQSWEPRNKPTYIWTVNLWQGIKEQKMEKGQSCQ